MTAGARRGRRATIRWRANRKAPTSWRIVASAVALFLGGLGCYAAGPPHDAFEPPPFRDASRTRGSEVQRLANLVNERRARLGRGALVWDDRLARVAQRHSEDMARRHFFSHVNPDGLDPFERLSAAGIRFRAAAENIGEGQRDADEMFEDWMDSPGHRRNLENGRYTRHGIGLYQRYWTHVFVREAGPEPTRRR
jgi:uncharacterized protein YkwD